MCMTVVCFTEEKDKGEGGQSLFHFLLEPRKWDFEAGSCTKMKVKKNLEDAANKFFCTPHCNCNKDFLFSCGFMVTLREIKKS